MQGGGSVYRHSNEKTHGTVENCERIDSFEAMRCDPNSWETGISAGGKVWLDCDHYVVQRGESEKEIVHLFHPGSRWEQELKLTRIDSGFGGTRAYWLCPACGERFRYLYFKKRRFICRKCAELNYKSQQETKNGLRYVRKGKKLAEERLGWLPQPMSPIDFAGFVPQKPKGMHWSTYFKHRRRLDRYQEQYVEDAMREMMQVYGKLGRFL